jgi:hypothetical protein
MALPAAVTVPSNSRVIMTIAFMKSFLAVILGFATVTSSTFSSQPPHIPSVHAFSLSLARRGNMQFGTGADANKETPGALTNVTPEEGRRLFREALEKLDSLRNAGDVRKNSRY